MKQEKDEAFGDMVTIVPYPNKWTLWDFLEIDGRNITTIQQFNDEIPNLFNGMKANVIYKYEIGNNQHLELLLNNNNNPRSVKFQITMLKRKNLSSKIRFRFEQDCRQS